MLWVQPRIISFLLKKHEPIVIAPNPDFAFGFQAQRPLKYSKRQRKLHRNTGGSRSIFTLDFNALHRVGGGWKLF
jgi:hypothetical protein